MLKPKKTPEGSIQAPLLLEKIAAVPNEKQLQAQLDEATNRRGVIVERPWTMPESKGEYTLMVQWDRGKEFPVWTLYENADSESTMQWSQSFPPSDIPTVFDVVAMSCERSLTGQRSDGIKIPDSLRPVAEPCQDNDPKGAAAPGGPGQSAYAYPGQTQPFPQQPYPQPGYQNPPYPTAPYPGQYVSNQQPMPQYNPGVSFQAPFTQAPNSISQNPYSHQAFAYETVSSPPKAPFEDLTAQTPNILLGALLIAADLITEPSLEAALKLQEMVRNGMINAEQAEETLKRFHAMGASIDQYMTQVDLNHKANDSKPGAPSPLDQSKGAERTPRQEEIAKTMTALDMLKKAGLLSDTDLQTALAVRHKHGGDPVTILESAGKLHRKTYETAVICVSLMADNLFKLEQCMIVLNYSARSRIGFDDVIEELGWPNPKK
jgi:hypothetical protein